MFCQRILLLLAFVTAVICLPNSAHAECSKAFVIGWEDFPPYSIKDPQGKRTGLDIDLAAAILKKAGCAYLFQDAPWKRLIEELKVGRIDILPGASKTTAREKFAHFSVPYRQEVMSIFMRRGEAAAVPLTKLTDLNNHKLIITAVLGTWYGEEYDAYSKLPEAQTTLLYIASNENPFRMLFEGRVSMVFADYYSGIAEASRINASPWSEIHDYPLNNSAVHLMLSSASTSPADKLLINEAARKLFKSGALQDIVQRYGFDPKKVLHNPDTAS